MKTPGALVEASVSVVPSVSVPVCVVESVVPMVSVPVCAVTSVVPVCVVSRCVYTSVLKRVLRRTHAGRKRACVKASPCVEEPPSENESPCASGVVTGVPACVLPGTPCVKGAPQPETARVCEARCANETPR